MKFLETITNKMVFKKINKEYRKFISPSLNLSPHKSKFGIVYTPNNLVKQMLNIIPKNLLQNQSLKWLDVGAGTGNFSQELFDLLNENLKQLIPDNDKRYNHILDNMLFMIEIYEPHIEILREKFKT